MYIRACGRRISILRSSCEQFLSAYQAALSDYLRAFLIHIVCETSYIMIRFPYSVLMIVFYSINTELRFYPRCPHY
ncbi:hypothetical protein EB661_25365 [Escherichia coli]|nr:hypothetical protein [Escherichia coli]EFN8403305.1 hypothetical protein [Escherichia coli]MDN0405597.1 hypothetical protein [Escherichia coli]MDN0435754.1 hypothetical protein [Escherichia coli]MDN0450325.1 hypothetical protein [Escherichia coli]